MPAAQAVGTTEWETEMMSPDSDNAKGGAVEESARLVWETPETVEVDLGAAETANTNSNFDGTNFSS